MGSGQYQMQQLSTQQSSQQQRAFGGGNNAAKYKTQMCRHFANSGHCVVGDACVFAHGDAELKKGGDSFTSN